MRGWTPLKTTLGSACAPLFSQRRWTTAEVPTEDELRDAYAALGVPVAAPFQDVKKRYVELAKQHHPDVNSGGKRDASKNMVNINNAYATLSKFYKAGGGFPNNFQSASGKSGQAYYTVHDEPYHPWHEDLNPLIYEVMWDEMRRQANSEAFAHAAAAAAAAQSGGWRHNSKNENCNSSSSGGGQQQHQQQYRQQDAESTKNGQKKTYKDNNRRHHKKGGNPQKTTTWPDADLQAMVNMYQDGKSFEFIANALGKQTPEVVTEFNRWSEGKKRSLRQAQRRPKGYYYAESPDIEFMDFDDDCGDPFGYVFEDDGDYVDPENIFFDSGSIPFRGGHHMSGPRPWRGGCRGKRGSSQRQW